MKKFIAIFTVVVMFLVLSSVANAVPTVYNVLPLFSTWTQTPADGSLGSTVSASGMFLPFVGNFTLNAVKLTDAVPSSLAGYQWETTYAPATVSISVDDVLITACDSLTNYNNNVSGVTNQFLFVGNGFTTDGRSFSFEVYWDNNYNPLVTSNLPGSVGSYLTGGTLTVCSQVPVPGAIILGGIGTALVGWMKRRKSL